ncbi:MFS transporter [Qaidamihabitans albus]|uniref:MFS transporter n=1 Tax=Qaidamihabitans albus TaxID=2795733 RepID=UPI0018F23F6A|nr:MFS transporter [Qaidamihabitans albus]
MKRLVPLMMGIYFMAFLDRANVSLAKEQLETDVGIGAAAYGFGAGVFFVSYALLEVPSNLILHRVGPRRWIARIGITWGLLTAAMMFISNEWSFYLLRFLLGAAEAGLYPGLMYMITVWFAQRDRSTIVGLMLIASTSAFALGNVAGGLLMQMDGVAQLHGWQWLFLVEGAVTVVVGLLVWLKLPDGPHSARWLTSDEARAITDSAGSAQSTGERRLRDDLRLAFGSLVIVVVALIWFFNQIATYGATYYIPAVASALGADGLVMIGLLAGLISLGPLIGIIVIPQLHKRFGLGREPHFIVAAVLGSLASCVAFLFAGSVLVQVLALSATMFFVVGIQPVIWSVVMARVSGVVAAAALAFVNTIGLTGGFVGPYTFGIAESLTGSSLSGFYVLATAMVLSVPLVAALAGVLRRREAGGAEPELDAVSG